MANDNTVLRERVAAGAALLDQRIGPDWHTSIDCATLDVRSNRDCVLAQVYGNYGIGLTKLDIFGLGRKQGFFTWKPGSYPILNELWRETIAQRRLTELKTHMQLAVHG